MALASALGGIVAAAIKARRAASALSAMRKGDLSREKILEFLEAFGLLGAALSTYFIAEKLIDASRLLHQAQDLSARAERTGENYLKVFDEYDRLGCGRAPDFTGS